MSKNQTFITIFLIALTFILFINNKSTYVYKTYKHTLSRNAPTTIVFVPGLGLQAKDYGYLINHLKDDNYQIITYTSKDTQITNYQITVDKWTKAIGTLIGNRKVIVIGHSVGGSVAVHFCSTDKRCIAGINLDGGADFDEKLTVPFLYIQADLGNYCDDQCIKGRALMEKIATQPGVHLVHITGIKHYNFTDLRTDSLKNQDYLGTIDGRDIIYTNIHTFLSKLPK
jgi:pimeloyl-ACP methyl ester carboxylesterase